MRTLFAPALLAFALLGQPALAHPDKSADIAEMEREMEALVERMQQLTEALDDAKVGETFEKGFGDGLAGDATENGDDRKVHKLIDDPKALRRAARDMERALEEADVFEGLAEMMIRLADDVTVVEDGDSVAFNFKGREVASLDAEDEERITLRAGGRKLTLEVE